MGLGKTLQALLILGYEHHLNHTGTSLILCPSSVLYHWRAEVLKFLPAHLLKTIVYYESKSTRKKIQTEIAQFNLIISSYETFRKDIDFLSQYQYSYIILDEGHLIKNPKTQLYQCIQLLKSQRRLILTGTPIQNSSIELWSLMNWLMPGYLGTEKEFNKLFAKPILNTQKTTQKSQVGNEEEHIIAAGEVALSKLHKKVLPFVLRRKKQDVLKDLPPKVICDRYVQLSSLQQTLYNRLTEELKDGHPNFKHMNLLRMLCTHPQLVMKTTSDFNLLPEEESLRTELSLPSPKLLLIEQILNECQLETTDEHKVLIFGQYMSSLDLVESMVLSQFPSIHFRRIDGTQKIPDRQKAIEDFTSQRHVKIMLLSTRAGGLGINLSVADVVIFLENDWNPSMDLQAMDRAHRIGAKKVIFVYRLLVSDTLEEKIMK